MRVEALFQSIYQQPSKTENAMATVEEDLNAYPAYPLAHLFKLMSMELSHPDYLSSLRIAGMHVSNPLVLQSFLKESAANNPEIAEPMPTSSDPIHNTPEIPVPATPTTSSKADLLFEPLYMTDYFASQGIKLSEDQLQKDQLGKQMRSFTEWLKTMKKSPGYRLSEQQTPLDPKVEKLAERSNVETDVITESMAEVLAEQGKTEKAIQIYEKLSLQFPAKSVYFARKISSLK
jgi:hypothetical protein